jgi:WD40 repeat protein
MAQMPLAQNENEDNDDDGDDEFDYLLDDPDLENLRDQRLAELQYAQQQKMNDLAKGHGEVRTISQDEFLPECTGSSDYVAVHFFHKEFERCRIMDHHFQEIAQTYTECKCLRIDAEKAPFFIDKLKVRTLPTLIIFQDGKAVDRLTGFEGLADDPTKPDEWSTRRLAQWMHQTGAIQDLNPTPVMFVRRTINASSVIESTAARIEAHKEKPTVATKMNEQSTQEKEQKGENTSSISDKTSPKEKEAEAGVTLKGHTASVQCLATWQGQWLVSGSEDGTVQLWSMDTPMSSSPVLTLQCESEVQAIAMCNHTTTESRPDTTSKLDAVILFACDKTLFACNLNKVFSPEEMPSHVTITMEKCDILWEATDEINQIVWLIAPATSNNVSSPANRGSRKKKKPSSASTMPLTVWIAAADDAGQVWVSSAPWQETIPQQSTLITHSKENALCLTVALRQTSKGKLEVVTGGSDCRIVQWQCATNSSTLKFISQSVVDVNATTSAGNENENSGQPVYNPPMIHQMIWMDEAATMAAVACGDGVVRIFQFTAGRLVLVSQVEHGNVPACVVDVVERSSQKLLCTAGNDSMLKLWNVTKMLGNNDTTTMDLDLDEKSPLLVQTIKRGSKPNAIVCTKDTKGETLLWIADTTNNITGCVLSED